MDGSQHRLRVALKPHFHRLLQQADLIRHTSDYSSTKEMTTANPFSTFKEYCASVEILLQHGTSRQHFQYLFVVYAVTNPDGITRSELLALIQDHVDMNNEDARFFEKTYTWLKKHFASTTAGQSYDAIATLLASHPQKLLDHVHINVDRFLGKVEANNTVHCLLPDDFVTLIQQD
ncbi:hypothetical protein H257_08414 [Aphanomyces astaci]|uniref:Uncharacterized protein n=2 Tax=Aphanomyces astaci TaxID=112090 RepID=W4GG39_APHAT|nr:hypothetical protein H257_08414 [Aphanomyces astaci]ETV78236.1 hypothetical protein H257_08414 [Aphanomyces astaci]|eukprot:XP_009832573.1 hypothetical protein H257_08414 [Aphanomyces astaci]